MFSDTDVRVNDGGCDPQGRFYCGTMANDAAPAGGRFYRFNVDGTAEVVFDRVTISNGFAFSPDQATACYVDSPTQRIDAFDYDPITGLTGRRCFAQIDPEDGCPDGITVDHDGGVWVACWGGGAVRRFAADGALGEIVLIPGVAQVSACTLGGPNHDQLFITTSRAGIVADIPGQAGAVFLVRDVIQGQPLQPARM